MSAWLAFAGPAVSGCGGFTNDDPRRGEPEPPLGVVPGAGGCIGMEAERGMCGASGDPFPCPLLLLLLYSPCCCCCMWPRSRLCDRWPSYAWAPCSALADRARRGCPGGGDGRWCCANGRVACCGWGWGWGCRGVCGGGDWGNAWEAEAGTARVCDWVDGRSTEKDEGRGRFCIYVYISAKNKING